MIASIDYVGLAALVSAFFGGLAALVAAIVAARTSRAVATPTGRDSIGQIAADVQRTVNGGIAPALGVPVPPPEPTPTPSP